MTPILAFALAGLVTYLLRAAVLIVARPSAYEADAANPGSTTTASGLRGLPAIHRLRALSGRAVALISPAVLGAVVASALFVSASGPSLAAPAQVAAIAAAIVAVRRTGSLGAALAVGFPTYWLLTLVGLG